MGLANWSEGLFVKLDKLKKNIGQRMELEPPACYLDEQGNPLPDKNEDWLVDEVTDAYVRLTNLTNQKVLLGTDHIYSFSTNPQHASADGKHGFLTLHVQIFVQGTRVFVRPNARPGERVVTSVVTIEEKIVGFGYPSKSGIQQRIETAGYEVRWSLESKLAERVDLDGWEVVVEPDARGQLVEFRCKDPSGDLKLIKRRV